MIEFRFPEILFLYIPFLILVFLDFTWSSKYQIFSDASANLKQVLFENINLSRVRLKQNLLFLSTAFLIFAASGPQIGTTLAPVNRKGLDLVFCIVLLAKSLRVHIFFLFCTIIRSIKF